MNLGSRDSSMSYCFQSLPIDGWHILLPLIAVIRKDIVLTVTTGHGTVKTVRLCVLEGINLPNNTVKISDFLKYYLLANSKYLRIMPYALS
jgi:hypothetical protein